MIDISSKRVPFFHLGNAGQVDVKYEANNDPFRAGFDILRNLNFELNQSIGYPTMHAKIVNYHGTGYRTSFGWIQIVTNFYRNNNIDEIFINVDTAPYMHKLGVPFFSYGNLPEIFDAPSNNIAHYSSLKWVADTFLTTMPDRSNNETISFLAGFRWGYIEYQQTDRIPVNLLPLEIIDGATWNTHLLILKEQCRHWQFVECTNH